MHPTTDAFLVHLADLGLSAASLAAYRTELLRQERLLTGLGQSWETAGTSTLLHAVAAGNRAPVTRRRAQHLIGRFLAFAGLPQGPEWRRLPAPRAVCPAPDCLSEAEEKALRKTLAKRVDQPTHARDRALFCLLLDTGLRVSEAAALTVGDVDRDGRRVRVTAKGGKRRSRFLPTETRDLLAGIAGTRDLEAPLFVSSTGGALTDRQIRRLLSRWAQLAGLQRSVHPHLLRHTFATSLLKKTGNLRLVQLALDHESPKTTAIYAHVADEELRTAIEGRRD
ncbi:MAG: tyrosine-type recombinase/integrase [Candidatus Delongbacteria bacterium]